MKKHGFGKCASVHNIAVFVFDVDPGEENKAIHTSNGGTFSPGKDFTCPHHQENSFSEAFSVEVTTYPHLESLDPTNEPQNEEQEPSSNTEELVSVRKSLYQRLLRIALDSGASIEE